MTGYFLYATRALPKDEPNAWTVRFYGQREQPGRYGQHGRPLALPEAQARWLGPRLAKEWRCEVAVVLPCAEMDGPHLYNTVGRWRYNQKSGEVETINEWGDTTEGYTHASGGESECDGVSSVAPVPGSVSGGA